MAGNIWGEGPRGGIFGARVDPALLRELEKRAEAKRQMAQGLEAAAEESSFEKQLAGLNRSKIPERNLPIPFSEGLAGTTGEMLQGVPVAGPALLGLGERLVAAKRSLMDDVPYSQALEEAQTRQEQFRRDQPRIAESAQAGGSALLAPAFGASVPAQMIGNAALSSADAMVRGQDPRYAAGEAAIAAAIPIPGAKGALKKAVRESKIFSDYSKIGHDIPITETAPIYVPGSGPKLIEKTFDPMTLKPGDRLVGSVGDRSHTGEDLGGIDIAGKQVMFKNPVPSEGGAGYMSHEFNPQDAFWASNQNPITLQEQRLLAHQKAAEKKGGDVYVVTQAMAAPGIDFSTQATRTALETLRRQPLNKEAKEALYTAIDEAMAAPRGKQFPAIADWPGMAKVMKSDRLLREMIGTRRSKLMKILDTDAMRKLGAPNMGAARYAATAPEQRNASVLESGFGWTRLGEDVKKLSPEEVLRGHSTYPWVNTSPGREYVGSQPMPVELVFPGLAKRVRGMDASGQQRTASMADVYEVVTPQQLERFQRWLESEKGKKLGIAGAVSAGLLTAAQANALFGEETARPSA
jgi:hypothetical protein